MHRKKYTTETVCQLAATLCVLGMEGCNVCTRGSQLWDSSAGPSEGEVLCWLQCTDCAKLAHRGELACDNVAAVFAGESAPAETGRGAGFGVESASWDG
mmetsp:Transcript_119161/g.167583  ORF Transcript_119161/g.167583 Transcript_119161/m.167583 type:complete len:99 (+) Transcript_119161:257-553(+)